MTRFEAAFKQLSGGKDSAEWNVSMPSRGFGDTVAKFTHATGLDKVAKVYTKITGNPCGCGQRQEKMNQSVPYKFKLPDSGLISPANQRIIQIEVTNACPHACSNCTRFTRLVPEPFFMNVSTFKRAVDSMAGYTGLVGMMGGEPTLHPDFAEMAIYFRKRWHATETSCALRQPINNFAEYQDIQLTRQDTPTRRGLWTSLGPGYERHFELIQDTFGYQCVNTHANGAIHQALLVTRKEARISDDEWLRLRDRCWVQRYWSASITPKGAFFCEIAAALDMLYNGPGGWPIEPGWWRRTPADFGGQLEWCELCGAALSTPCVLASEEIQQVSPVHAAKLAGIGSPCEKIVVPEQLTTDAPPPSSADWYMPKSDKAKRAGNYNLGPKRIECIITSVDCVEELRRTLPSRVASVDRCIVVTASHDEETRLIAMAEGAEVVITDACYDNDMVFNKGALLNAGLAALSLNDWVIFSDADIYFPENWRESIGGLVLNPGCLYYARRFQLPRTAEIPDWKYVLDRFTQTDPHTNAAPWGYFQLWNQRALQFVESPLYFPGCFCSAGSIDHWFQAQWPRDKTIPLPRESRFDLLHLWHGRMAGRWNGSQSTAGRWRFSSQSSMGPEKTLMHRWPNPCLVRRTNIVTGDMIERSFDGTPIQWGVTDKKAKYEYSVKEL